MTTHQEQPDQNPNTPSKKDDQQQQSSPNKQQQDKSPAERDAEKSQI